MIQYIPLINNTYIDFCEAFVDLGRGVAAEPRDMTLVDLFPRDWVPVRDWANPISSVGSSGPVSASSNFTS